MSVTNILVEGKDDIAFLSRLIDVMRAECGLPPLRWRLVNRENKVIVNGAKKLWFGDETTEIGTDCVAITETGGVYQRPGPSLLSVKTPTPRKVDQIIAFFDADAPVNFLGNPVEAGGLSRRREYVEKLYSGLPVGRKFFLFPTDSKDGTLEDLVISMIDPEIKFVIDRNWASYRQSVRLDLKGVNRSYLEYSAKCALSQFATVFDEDVAKDLYWVAALWNEDRLWNWQSVTLQPLKAFLHINVPVLFREIQNVPTDKRQ